MRHKQEAKSMALTLKQLHEPSPLHVPLNRDERTHDQMGGKRRNGLQDVQRA
jgi:hypothetical protein